MTITSTTIETIHPAQLDAVAGGVTVSTQVGSTQIGSKAGEQEEHRHQHKHHSHRTHDQHLQQPMANQHFPLGGRR